MAWTDSVAQGSELTLATVTNDGQPHANIVKSLGLQDGQILIGDCIMVTTRANIENNPKVVLIAKVNGEYYRIKGTVTVYNEGKYLDLAISMSKPPMPVKALMVKVDEVYDLGNGKPVDL